MVIECLLFPSLDLGGNVQKADWTARSGAERCGREVGSRSSQSCPGAASLLPPKLPSAVRAPARPSPYVIPSIADEGDLKLSRLLSLNLCFLWRLQLDWSRHYGGLRCPHERLRDFST